MQRRLVLLRAQATRTAAILGSGIHTSMAVAMISMGDVGSIIIRTIGLATLQRMLCLVIGIGRGKPAIRRGAAVVIVAMVTGTLESIIVVLKSMESALSTTVQIQEHVILQRIRCGVTGIVIEESVTSSKYASSRLLGREISVMKPAPS